MTGKVGGAEDRAMRLVQKSKQHGTAPGSSDWTLQCEKLEACIGPDTVAALQAMQHLWSRSSYAAALAPQIEGLQKCEHYLNLMHEIAPEALRHMHVGVLADSRQRILLTEPELGAWSGEAVVAGSFSVNADMKGMHVALVQAAGGRPELSSSRGVPPAAASLMATLSTGVVEFIWRDRRAFEADMCVPSRKS